MKTAISVIIAGIIAGLFLIWISEDAESHEWYPEGCCSQKDCRALEPGEMKLTPRGWQVDKTDRRFESLADFRKSPDKKWHACFYLNGFLAGQIRWAKKKPCVWAPESDI